MAEAGADAAFAAVRAALDLDEQRERVLACTDLAQLEGWVHKAVTVKTTAELFAPPKARR